MPAAILSPLQKTIEKLTNEFPQIPSDRKSITQELTDFIKQRSNAGEKIQLNFICTHNSRRSHIAQLWGQTAAHYFGIPNVETFSGGTEATAFNPKAVKAMKNAGFEIVVKKDGINPTYEGRYSQELPGLTLFSKRYDDPFNPQKDFAAIMTCSHADENCPVVIGASKRISLTYDDPKDFDGTAQETEKYRERVQEIGREILFAFSQVK
jgi:arsenate reductase